MRENRLEQLAEVLGFGSKKSCGLTREALLAVFGKTPPLIDNIAVIRGAVQEFDGVRITELSWNVGWGRDTKALLLTPLEYMGPLPGVLYLHSHDDLKEFGK